MSAASSVANLLKAFPQFLSLHGKAFPSSESFRFEGLEEGLPRGTLVEVSGSPGGGKTEVVLRFLAQNPEVRAAWVEEEFSVYPCAFPPNRVGLERVLFVDSPPGEALWSVHQMLRSGVFGVIVVRLAPATEAQGCAEPPRSRGESPMRTPRRGETGVCDGCAEPPRSRGESPMRPSLLQQGRLPPKGEPGGATEMDLRRLQLAAERAGVTVVLLADAPAKRGTWPISVQLQASRRGAAVSLDVLKYRGRKSWQISIG